jgi:hypothetical protein
MVIAVIRPASASISSPFEDVSPEGYGCCSSGSVAYRKGRQALTCW